MTKVTTDTQLSGSPHYGNIRYVIHIHYMQDLNNVKYESYSTACRVVSERDPTSLGRDNPVARIDNITQP
jgi:hypothetical protein